MMMIMIMIMITFERQPKHLLLLSDKH